MPLIAWLVALSTQRSQYAASLGIAGATAAGFAALLLGLVGWQPWSPVHMAAGVLGYTLAEYWYHRAVAHRWLDSVMVDAHHAVPDDWFAAPWCLIVPVAASLYLWVVGLADVPFATGFMVGVSACHLWQEGVHWAAHHTRWPWMLLWHHLLHHQVETVNFGHSTTLWDRVFRTKLG